MASSSAHPTVQNHHVAGVRGQPRLHCFANGANSVQGRSVKVRPAVVLHLKRSRGNVNISGLSRAVNSLTSRVDVKKSTFGESLVMSCLFSDKFRSWERKKERQAGLFLCVHYKMSNILRGTVELDSVIYKTCCTHASAEDTSARCLSSVTTDQELVLVLGLQHGRHFL